ncbi:hypothetical protein [Vibrio phage Va2]|nr:hypothetical protein [Vibrio phage Va2]
MKLTDPVSGNVVYCELDDIKSAVIVNETGKKSAQLSVNGALVLLDYSNSDNQDEFKKLLKDLELKFA